MENAVKAMYIAAGMLLGVMILSVLVYLFSQGASLGKNYDIDRRTEQITAFNSQFEKYAGRAIQRTTVAYGYSFEEKSNIPSDVITCANLAYNINRKNEYDDKNHVEVIVKLGGSTSYYVYPYESQPKNYFLINMSKSSARNATSINTSDSSQCKSFYEFLQQYSNVKIVNISSTNYNYSGETIYEYYFDVDKDETGTAGMGLHYSDVTGKVDKIVFTAVKTNRFDDLGGGTWTENL